MFNEKAYIIIKELEFKSMLERFETDRVSDDDKAIEYEVISDCEIFNKKIDSIIKDCKEKRSKGHRDSEIAYKEQDGEADNRNNIKAACHIIKDEHGMPAAAAVLVSFALSYNIFAFDANGKVMPFMQTYLPHIYNLTAFITIGLALLMVSNIPYAAFKGKKEGAPRKRITVTKLALIAIIIAFLFKYPQDMVFIIFGLYALMGIIMVIFKAFKNMAVKKD